MRIGYAFFLVIPSSVFGFVPVTTTCTGSFKPTFSSPSAPACRTKYKHQIQSMLAVLSYKETTQMESLSEQSPPPVPPRQNTIDPLLTNALGQLRASSLDLGGVMTASNGVCVWRTVLLKGRLPTEFDFRDSTNDTVWPQEPLFSRLCQAMADMQLSRFVLRHPEIVSAVLLSLIKLTVEFTEELRLLQNGNDEENDEEEEEIDDDDDDDCTDENMYVAINEDFDDDTQSSELEDMDDQLSSEEMDQLAVDVASGLTDQWGGVLAGVNLLDQLFGRGHGILNLAVQQQETGGGGAGLGLQDGIWKHTGWQIIPELQRQIARMPELKELMNELGRRPTAEISDNKVHKFAPRKFDATGGLGAQFDPHMPDSVTGITLSSSLSEMLPSEAVLLRGKSPALRRLFLAKMVESKLLSYQLSSWADVPSIPVQTTRRTRMPSAPGGPILVCLDTSWSMSGMREHLSKAVVLACVSAAHKQQRDCKIVAFSTERGTMESGIISADAAGIQRLLDFLSGSFGGGTDVTGALKFAMTALDNTDNSIMSAADVLLVTDGEIKDPPVSKDVMEALDRLKIRTGMEIHGLLVGKRESKPLSRLCTKTHDFLLGYETQTYAAVEAQQRSTTTALLSSASASSHSSLRIRLPNSVGHGYGRKWGGGRTALESLHRPNKGRSFVSRALCAKYSTYGDEGGASGKKRKNGRNGNTWDDDEGDYVIVRSAEDDNDFEEDDESGLSEGTDFVTLADKATNALKLAVAANLKEQLWKVSNLDKEKNSQGSCWQYRGELQAAVERVGEGLVERQEESKLVVLAMVAKEHVLLLGVPGTGKSILGRRLSKLCNGSFFQRLLTRFTTPEEIFGPLSLAALERDEYRRCTKGFLPAASVAFLDEIFKANSAILNTLLTILNERKFDNAGGQEDCPIRCVVGASNELPESDELDALYDRFLLRKEVLPVSDDGVLKMLAMSNPGFSSCDSDNRNTETSCDVVFSDGLDEVVSALSVAAGSIHMGDDACALMRDLRSYMREEQSTEVSDRRLVKAARLLKISAASHGRNRVDPIDCLLLQHVVWRLPEQRMAVRDWLWDNLTPGGSVGQFRLLLDGLRGEILNTVRKTSGDVSGASGGRGADVALIESLRMEVSRIVIILKQRQADLARHMELLGRSNDHLWLDPDEAQAAQQLLLPRAKAVSGEVDRALSDACALEMSLSEVPSAPSNDLRLSVIERLWDEESSSDVEFTDEELNIGMKEAKGKFDLETFRKWKRARKRAQN